MFCCRYARFAVVFLTVLFTITIPAQLFAAGSIGQATLAVQAEAVPQKMVRVGDDVFVGSEYATGAEGTLTLLFVDESVLTLLPGSRAVIEEFSMGKDGKKGKCIIKIISGKYRWVPGKILAEGGLQYVSDASPGRPGATGTPGGYQVGVGPAGKGKGNAGQGPALVSSQSGNAQAGGTAAGVFYNKKCEDCPTPSPGIQASTYGTLSTGGTNSGIPIINTGAFDNQGQRIVLPEEIGASTGTNWVPTDDMMSHQGPMMGNLQSSPGIMVPNTGTLGESGYNAGVPIIKPGVDPSAAAAQDIASMLKQPVSPAALGAGIVEPGMAQGVVVKPGADLGAAAAPTKQVGALASPKIEAGALAAPTVDVGRTLATSVETGIVAAPKVDVGTVVAPTVEAGALAAPRVEVGTFAAPTVEVGTIAAPKVEVRTVAAPTVESATMVAPTTISPTVEIGTEKLSAPLTK